MKNEVGYLGVKGYIFQEPKTAAGIRTIALSQMTVNELKKQKELLEDEQNKAEENKIEYANYGLVAQVSWKRDGAIYY